MSKLLALILKPHAWVASIILIIFIIIFLFFGFLDYLQPIKDFLNSDTLTFKVGTMKFSPYLLGKSLLIIISLFWFASIFSDFAEKRIKSIRGIKASNKSLIVKSIQIIIYFLAFFIGLDVLNVDFTTITIFSGAIGIGVGFGLQKITSNFISGLILLFEKSIESDDVIELSDGIYGFVRYTSARYTLIETLDGKEIMIPNEDFITSRVTNWTYSNSRGRIEIPIGISYESDIDKAHDLVLEVVSNHPRCMSEPAPKFHLREFGDSSINFLLFFWIDDVSDGRFTAQSEIMFAIWKTFKKNNITIPYPQRDVHIKK